MFFLQILCTKLHELRLAVHDNFSVVKRDFEDSNELSADTKILMSRALNFSRRILFLVDCQMAMKLTNQVKKRLEDKRKERWKRLF